MMDTVTTSRAPVSNAPELAVRLSRFTDFFYFDIRHEDQRRWSSEISTQAEHSVATVMAAIAMGYNSAAKTDVPVFFVASISPDVTVRRSDVVDLSDVYADVHEHLADVPSATLPYAVYATKSAEAVAHLVETFGPFGMLFPLGIQANLWLQIGVNSWDFVLNDRAAECLPDHVLQAFADERLELVPTSPEPFIHRRVRAEKTVEDFERVRPVRFKR